MPTSRASSLSARPFAPLRNVCTTSRPFTSRLPARRTVVVRAEEEQTPEKIDGKTVKKVSDPMSPEFKARLREEYVGLGGSASKPMGSNYFVWISLIIATLAILSKALGYI